MDAVVCYFNIMVTRYLKFFGSISHCISPSAWTVHEQCLVNIVGNHIPPVCMCIYIYINIYIYIKYELYNVSC